MVALAMGDLAPAADDSVDSEAFAEVALLPPIQRPPAIRDFMIFEGHVANSLRRWNRPVPERWYVEPSFYFTNPSTLHPSGSMIQAPAFGVELDYELELGVVIGRELVDASPDEAASAIAGFTILNDFSLRDQQSAERPLGLGPSKSKDFATGLGPVLVTPNDIPGTARRPDLRMEAYVNGELWSQGESRTMHFDLGEVIAHASAGSRVVPGDIIGTGTVTTGCILELLSIAEDNRVRWLKPGDTVELRVDGIGTLRNTIAPRSQ